MSDYEGSDDEFSFAEEGIDREARISKYPFWSAAFFRHQALLDDDFAECVDYDDYKNVVINSSPFYRYAICTLKQRRFPPELLDLILN